MTEPFILYSDKFSLTLRFDTLLVAEAFAKERWGEKTVLVTSFPTSKIYADLDAIFKEAEGDSLAGPVGTLKHVEGAEADWLRDKIPAHEDALSLGVERATVDDLQKSLIEAVEAIPDVITGEELATLNAVEEVVLNRRASYRTFSSGTVTPTALKLATWRVWHALPSWRKVS